MKAITPHYIDGQFVEPHGREVMDSINPKLSGVGREFGAFGIEAFLEPRAILE